MIPTGKFSEEVVRGGEGGAEGIRKEPTESGRLLEGSPEQREGILPLVILRMSIFIFILLHPELQDFMSCFSGF
ncbi:hypothetical protein AV540_25605 [Brevibacillus parabrevis]|nr:hypothetical protein AV540_25605 [Brevibacillus parabrevis]